MTKKSNENTNYNTVALYKISYNVLDKKCLNEVGNVPGFHVSMPAGMQGKAEGTNIGISSIWVE